MPFAFLSNCRYFQSASFCQHKGHADVCQFFILYAVALCVKYRPCLCLIICIQPMSADCRTLVLKCIFCVKFRSVISYVVELSCCCVAHQILCVRLFIVSLCCAEYCVSQVHTHQVYVTLSLTYFDSPRCRCSPRCPKSL